LTSFHCGKSESSQEVPARSTRRRSEARLAGILSNIHVVPIALRLRSRMRLRDIVKPSCYRERVNSRKRSPADSTQVHAARVLSTELLNDRYKVTLSRSRRTRDQIKCDKFVTASVSRTFLVGAVPSDRIAL